MAPLEKYAVRIPLTEEELHKFCEKWKISELSLFGSITRDDFDETSDVDFLVSYEPYCGWGFLDAIEMKNELSTLLGRKVDLVSRKGIERSKNYLRRKAILSTAVPFYEKNR